MQINLLKALCCKSRVAVRWCRQVGKTTVLGWYCLFKCLTTKNYNIVIVAPGLRQSQGFFQRIRDIVDNNENIKPMVSCKTQTCIWFRNGSKIECLPCGPTGATIAGKTADCVIMEEAGYMKDTIVNRIIMPFIASKGDKGQAIKIGTPFNKGHFYNSCKGGRYYESHVDYIQAIKEGALSQEFIDEMREECTELEFKTEWEAEFIEDADCYFKADTILESILDYPVITEVYT